MEGIKKGNAVYDLVAADEVRHVVWRVEDQADIDAISRYFDQLDHTYVADGHHRTAAAALVGRELQNKNRYQDQD